VYTLVYNRRRFEGTHLARRQVIPSFIDCLPWARKLHRSYLPLYPLAIEQFDLRAYDVILSSSYAVAHGVMVRPEQLHISLMHTPLRYAWHQYHTSFRESGIKSWPARVLLHYLRLWDTAAANRVDQFVAVSQWVAGLIWRAYRRPAQVIYPPVDVERFKPLTPKGDYYLTVSRLAQHKRVDLIVQAFSRMGLPLIVVGEGAEHRRLSQMAAPNVKLVGWQPGERVQELMGRAKALVHAAEEEFGIALVEAQAAGCPVIAYGRGGAAETVLEGTTGLLFNEQTVESLMEAVLSYQAGGLQASPDELRWNVQRFRKERFQKELQDLIAENRSSFQYRELAYSPLMR
jgi:glycosyltransferase involved in cell wall biosynthesis